MLPTALNFSQTVSPATYHPLRTCTTLKFTMYLMTLIKHFEVRKQQKGR